MQRKTDVINEKKWNEILHACDAAKHRCLLTSPHSSFMNDKDRELFNDIYSEAIRGRDWSIYNDETLQVLKGIHIYDNLLDEMAKDVLLEALDKWCQRNEIEKEKRIAVQEALIKMRAEMDLALQEQEKKLSAEKDEAVQKAVQEKVLELAAKGAASPTPIVELSDESAKKVACLTSTEVKKFLKPGRGSKNTRFPNETKEACVRIWEKYKGNPEVKKLAQKRKVSHKDVFEYAQGELEKIGIHSADEFHRVLGAASDKKNKESYAVKKKKPQ